MTSKLKNLIASASVLAVVMGSAPAMAAPTTAAGTAINNNVSVAFNVGGVAQVAETDSDAFVVDRKVNFTVAETNNTAMSVVPAAQDQVLTFTVTNTTNDTLDFDLSVAALTGGTTRNGETDNFDVTGLEICVDLNSNGSCDGGAELTTTIDNLADSASRTVFVRGDIPNTQVNGDAAGYTLTATAKNGDGSAIVAEDDSDANTAGMETIFADTGRDGIESDGDEFLVETAELSVTKFSYVISDGVSATNPKAVPGAVIEYCIAVSNAATAGGTATGITVTDDISGITDVTYVASSAKVDGSYSGGATCTPGATNGSEASGVVSGTLSNIAPGQTRTLTFRVTID